MTLESTLTCAWCGKSFARTSPRGPAPIYCGTPHRQAAQRARRAQPTSSAPTAVTTLQAEAIGASQKYLESQMFRILSALNAAKQISSSQIRDMLAASNALVELSRPKILDAIRTPEIAPNLGAYLAESTRSVEIAAEFASGYQQRMDELLGSANLFAGAEAHLGSTTRIAGLTMRANANMIETLLAGVDLQAVSKDLEELSTPTATLLTGVHESVTETMRSLSGLLGGDVAAEAERILTEAGPLDEEQPQALLPAEGDELTAEQYSALITLVVLSMIMQLHATSLLAHAVSGTYQAASDLWDLFRVLCGKYPALDMAASAGTFAAGVHYAADDEKPSDDPPVSNP
jgi:hypothetical protein